MGKKVKTGKHRQDKFYHLAKETGYRARSAFKLLQLNRKYEFLQKSRVVVDLCAAPGGWLQVAAQHTPVSSIIIGIDLNPIKPIARCTTFQEDITSVKCRQILKKELHEFQADVFLNDGAPNVGKNWIHDAFMQAELTLSALKLATEFLCRGGWFITKVFRSKDYTALMWVFGQLFKKVYATKPQASRNESAEIFVVCQGYLKPDKLDARFTDSKYVFQDVESETKKSLNVIHPTKKQQPKAVGYDEGIVQLHQKLPASQFIKDANYLELLGGANEVVLDDPVIAEHEKTTTEIRECLKDIRVLGKKEIRTIINWRKKMIDYLEKQKPETDKVEEMEVVEEEEDEEAAIDKQIAEAKEEEVAALKKKRKQVLKEKRKLRDKMNLKMIIKGDEITHQEEMDLFSIKQIKNKNELSEVSKEERLEEEEEESGSDDEFMKNKKRATIAYTKNECDDGITDSEDEGEEEKEGEQEEEDSDDDDAELEMEEYDNENDSNPLIMNLEGKKTIVSRKTDMWFSKTAFAGLEGEDDEDIDIETATKKYKEKGGVIIGEEPKTKKRKVEEVEEVEEEDSGNASESDAAEESDSGDDDDDSDSDSGEDYNVDKALQQQQAMQQPNKQKLNNKNKDGFEVVSQNALPSKKILKLDPEGLALGEELIKSSKRRREILEMSYNRYQFDDEGLPDWFSKDERKHSHIMIPVTKAQVDEYKQRLTAIDARPIKKIGEAKARKKKKAMNKSEKARRKAEAVSETCDVTDKEKMHQIKAIYKKAGLLKQKKEEKKYVVAKRGAKQGKRATRPDGVKGVFKVVDPRLKKDARKEKNRAKTVGRGKKAPAHKKSLLNQGGSKKMGTKSKRKKDY